MFLHYVTLENDTVLFRAIYSGAVTNSVEVGQPVVTDAAVVLDRGS